MSFSQDIKEELSALPEDKKNPIGFFLRKAFLESGSISDPDKSYHFEIVCADISKAQEVIQAFSSFDVDAKVVVRGKNEVVYLKEADKISDALAIMGSRKGVLEFENARVVHNFRGKIQRQVNCEAHNLIKAVNAGNAQIADINLIKNVNGLDSLPDALRQVAEARLNNPDTPLKELGEMMDPPVGKSGVNHRLRRISEIAAKLRQS